MVISLSKTQVLGESRTVGTAPVAVLALLIVISETPILSRNIPNAIFYGMVLVFFALTFNIYHNLGSEEKLLLYLTGLYLVLLTVYKAAGLSDAALSYYSTTVKFYFFLVAMLGISEYLSDEQKKFLLAVIVLTVLLVLFDNIRLYMQYGPARYVSLFQKERFATNSVNTAFVASLVFFSGALFSCFLYLKNRTLRLVSLGISGFCLLFIAVIAQRASILALALVMFPLLIMYNTKSNRGRIVLWVLGILLLFVVIIDYRQVLDTIDQMVGSRRMSLRIAQIRNLLSSGNISEAGGSLTARYRLIHRSVSTFFSSPLTFLVGAGDHRADYSVIGNHSYFFDELARYGTAGAFIWIPMMIMYLKQMVKRAEVNDNYKLKALLFVLIFILVARSFIGGLLDATMAIQVFVFIPLLFSLLQKDQTV